jgi:hypothetical protein
MNPLTCAGPHGNRLSLAGLALVCFLALSGIASIRGDEPPSPAATVLVAGDGVAPSPVVFADGWSVKRLFSGLNNRGRVVQLCIVTMCLALFILMRKFGEGHRG